MSKTYRVRLLIETSRAFGRGLLRGICRYRSRHGPWQVEQEAPVHVGPGSVAETRLGKSALQVDGIIMRDRKGSLELLKKKVPVIFVAYLHEDVLGTHRIVTDDPAIVRLAAAHLLERGFRHFAFVGYDSMVWSRRRRDGFMQAVNRAGFECGAFVQARHRKERQWPRERTSLAEWLRGLPKPIGLLACNDDRARQVVDACRAAGLRIPEEVAIVGVDNDEFVCNLSNPPISSIALDFEDAGCRAAQLLDRLMTGAKPRPQTITPAALGVVTRRSSDITVIEDPLVARAVQFIRANAHKPVYVPDLLREVGVSGRWLSSRFQQVLGCGVHEYVKKVHVAQIERLLLETDCTLTEIAGRLGFPDASHVARYFRSVRGTNPLTLRSSRRK